jgi:hypothetical protein
MVELRTRKREMKRYGEIMMRIWDIREFCMRVNLPSPIHPDRVPIRHVITPIRSLLNRIGQVALLISHGRSYPPHRSQLHPPSLAILCTTLPSLQNPNLCHPSLSLHVMIISWQRVEHTLCTAHTVNSLHHVQYTPCIAYTVYSIHLLKHPPKIVVLPWLSWLRVEHSM